MDSTDDETPPLAGGDAQIFHGHPAHLRPLDDTVLPTLLGWLRKDPEVLRYLRWFLPLQTDASEAVWLEQMRRSPSDYVFAIVEASTDSPAGTIGLHKVDDVDRCAELGIYVAQGFRDRGLGPAALRKMLRWGFEVRNLHRIDLHVYEYNHRARGVYERAGFTREGTLRRARYLDGRYWDIDVYGILEDEFRGRGDGA